MNNNYLGAKAQYSDFLKQLVNCNNALDAIPVHHNSCVEVRDRIIPVIKQEIESITNEILAIDSMAWDNLVIAFFGETNAGKSTIIETFRILYDPNYMPGNDGLIVGDGSSDFTRDYHEYKLNMNGVPFTLIDVPGIEGNENEFRDVIKDALHKAHLVFYVQGHNKKPDIGTAQKIKNYLGQWVYVYSIQNVRGGVSNYDEEEERETLLTELVKQNDLLIQAEFKRILGDVYKGNVIMQAQLAMCAKGSFSPRRQDLIMYQNKLISYFGSAENTFNFSRFSAIEQLVKGASQSYPVMIQQANQQKLYGLKLRLKDKIRQIPTSDLESAMSEMGRYLQSMMSAISDEKRTIESKCNLSIENRFGELNDDLCGDVDADILEKYASSDQEKCRRAITEDINSIFRTEMHSLHERLETLRREMRFINVGYINASSDGIDTNVNTYNAEDALSYGLGDFVMQSVSTLGTAGTGAAIGSFFGPVGTGIGAIVGGLAGLIFGDSSSERKTKAKDEVRKAINKAKSEAKESLSDSLQNGPFQILDRYQKNIENQINKEATNVYKVLAIVKSMYQI
ncbi:MAG: 50S ribosome-binding GTPase [Bacteroidales bacterium]|nr:50S ribosome-binding GTPase [Candidatus Physcocola equi]